MGSLFQAYDDNILVGSTLSSNPSVMDSYDLQTLLEHRPSRRVRWDVPSPNTVNIRADLSTPKQADLLVIPIWNADAGSSVVTLTNDDGLNVVIPVPAMPSHGIARTLAVDLRALQPNALIRTSNGFNVIVTGNSVALVMGGFLALYGPVRTFSERDFQWGIRRDPLGYAAVHQNNRGAELVQPWRTLGNTYELTAVVTDAERAALIEWAESNFIGGLPCFIWVDPDGRNVPIVGLLKSMPTEDQFTDAIGITFTVSELSKGKPVA